MFICCELLVGFHIRIISVFGNTEIKLIEMCNFYSIFSCISKLNGCKPKLYCGLDDREDYCSVCQVLD